MPTTYSSNGSARIEPPPPITPRVKPTRTPDMSVRMSTGVMGWPPPWPCDSVPEQRRCPCPPASPRRTPAPPRSEEHTSELQSLMRISYAVFCLKKKRTKDTAHIYITTNEK